MKQIDSVTASYNTEPCGVVYIKQTFYTNINSEGRQLARLWPPGVYKTRGSCVRCYRIHFLPPGERTKLQSALCKRMLIVKRLVSLSVYFKERNQCQRWRPRRTPKHKRFNEQVTCVKYSEKLCCRLLYQHEVKLWPKSLRICWKCVLLNRFFSLILK